MNLSKEKRENLINAINEMRKDANLSEKHLNTLNEIENELNHKKYGLVWEEYTEEVLEKIKTHIPVFTEEKDKEIEVDNGELCEPQYNFLIEGDNLHSLYLLQKTHKGKLM